MVLLDQERPSWYVTWPWVELSKSDKQLRGLLGEARVLKGSVLSPRTAPDAVPLNGGEIHRNWTTESWLIDSVAYAPQQAFIRHGTIRDNICFGQPFWKDRYKEALRQSALLSDLDIMESGDMTEVGEHGTTLVGTSALSRFSC